ncbi:MAG: heme exporter protein CcmB [Chloroflexota bacterium]
MNTFRLRHIRQYIRITLAIAAKDLRAEARGRKILAVWASMGILLLVVFYVTITLSQIAFATVAPSVLWFIFALIGTIGLGRGFHQEYSLGGWQALLISPINHSAIYFGKLLSNLIVTLIAEIAVIVAFSIIYHWPVDSMGMLLVLILGTTGFMGVGTLVSAFLADKPTKELLLPVMVLPIVIPIIALSSQLTSTVLAQPLTSDWIIVILFLLGYDAIIIIAGAAAFSFIAELY